MADFVDRRSGTGKEKPAEKKPVEIPPAAGEPAPPRPEKVDMSEEASADGAGVQAGQARADFIGLSEYLFANIQMMLHESGQAKPEERTLIFQMTRQWIDWLEILQKKTQGNLGVIEAKHLEECLHQSRLAFVGAINAPPAADARKEEPKVK